MEPERKVIPFKRPVPREPGANPADLRFRRLIGEEGWAALPASVRARFGKRVGAGRTVIYAGETIECRMNRVGWLLAQAARLIGAPLPVSRDVFLPAAVSVTEDAEHGGQFWTRIYGRAHGFPQVIHSSKRFCGPTGLEEYLGRGTGVALTVRWKAARCTSSVTIISLSSGRYGCASRAGYPPARFGSATSIAVTAGLLSCWC